MYRRSSNNSINNKSATGSSSSTSSTPKLPPISASSSIIADNNNKKTNSSPSASSVSQTQQRLHSQLQKHEQSFNEQDTRPILTLEVCPDLQNSVFASLADLLFANNGVNTSSTNSNNNNNNNVTTKSSARTRTEAKWISSRVKINSNHQLAKSGNSASSSSSSSSSPCCIQLSGINLYLGLKATTERLVTEAGMVCNRVRKSGGKMNVCPHMERKDKLPDAEYTSYPNRIIVAFFPGTKPITLKANMAKSLCDHFSANFAFRHISPESYVLIPRREIVADNFSGGNTNVMTKLTDQRGMWIKSIQDSMGSSSSSSSSSSSVWIAKSSHGAKGRDLKIIKVGGNSNENNISSDASPPPSSHRQKLCYNDPMDFLDKFDRSLDSNPWVVQKYIDRPLLYNGRKFDLRAWVLLTPRLEIFLYKEGVCRMCSVEYGDGGNFNDAFAHLSNNCLQEAHSNFGKHEKGNLLSFDEFDANLLSKLRRRDVVREDNSVQVNKNNNRIASLLQGINPKFLSCPSSSEQQQQQQQNGNNKNQNLSLAAKTLTPLSCSELCALQQQQQQNNNNNNNNNENNNSNNDFMSFNKDVLPQMRRIIGNCFSSVKSQILPVYDMGAIDCFQYFGFDFMLDSSMKLWLLEVNGAAGVADYLLRPTVEDLAETVIYDMLPQSRPPDCIQQELRRKRPNWFVKIFGKEEW